MENVQYVSFLQAKVLNVTFCCQFLKPLPLLHVKSTS